MRRYTVRMTEQAEKHVLEYAEYIKYDLMNPQAAIRFVDDIRTAVNSLIQMPQRNPLLEDGPWPNVELHKMMVRGYVIYYWIEDASKTVHVTGVIYGKRDQAEQLASIDLQ